MNPQVTCVGCGQTDDHHKHRVIRTDGSEAAWHADCHAGAIDCPHCAAVVASAPGLTGAALVEHVQRHNPAGYVSAFEGG